MQEMIQLLVNGVALGSVYALAALGFVIVYSATSVVNFAAGQFVMLGTSSSGSAPSSRRNGPRPWLIRPRSR
jgi:branched-subunit amino acid ABC-type transport system permease component